MLDEWVVFTECFKVSSCPIIIVNIHHVCVCLSLTQESPTCLPIRRCATHVYSFLRLLTNHLYGNLFLYLSILRRGYHRSELGMPARRQVRGVRAISPNLVPSRWCRFVRAKLRARLWRLATSGLHRSPCKDATRWTCLNLASCDTDFSISLSKVTCNPRCLLGCV